MQLSTMKALRLLAVWTAAGSLLFGTLLLIERARAHTTLLRTMIDPAFQRGFLMVLFGAAVATLAMWLRLREKPLEALERQREEERIQREEAEFQAAVNAPLVSIVVPGALLDHDEVSYVAISAQLIQERSVGYTSGGLGVSINVVKGVNVGLGSTHGRIVRRDVVVSGGTLYVTNKRVIFAGERKSAAVRLTQVLGLQPYAQGLQIITPSKTLTFDTNTRLDAARVESVIVRAKALQARDLNAA